MQEFSWNPWHGCHRKSPGCLHCYVYRMDEAHERDASVIRKTGDFCLPVKKNRAGEYRIPGGSTAATCFTSDFLLEDADPWRDEAWRMMRERSDVRFMFITKRIERLRGCVPPDWGFGYENVSIGCTCEDQQRADERLGIFHDAPVKHKFIVCEPLLGHVDMSAHLGKWAELVSVGGESGTDARECDFAWVLDIRRQCVEAGVSFRFRQTGANFVKDAKRYKILRKDQFSQAGKAGINYTPEETDGYTSH